MIKTAALRVSPLAIVRSRITDYSQLVKMRLTMTVVFSSAMGFLLASGSTINWAEMWLLVAGGFMVVGSANGINQIIEKNFDRLMLRTANRPIATGRMSIAEAAVFCTILGVSGVFIITRYLNEAAGWLAFASLVSYAFIYTPLKRISPVAVFVGAFPGAIPPALGWVAVTGNIDQMAFGLFLIQFFWQFPHFWAIAWVLDEDYKRAGYHLLPSFEGRGKKSARQVVWYTIALIPFTLVPYLMNITGIVSAVIAVLSGIVFLWYAFRLLKTCKDADAKKLMFASFMYLPVILTAFVLDKL